MDLDIKKPANKAIQGQVCFSLASASTIAEDYQMGMKNLLLIATLLAAIEYHLKHLRIARELEDAVGEIRAHASLTTNYRSHPYLSDYLFI